MRDYITFLAAAFFLVGCEGLSGPNENSSLVIDPTVPIEQTIGSTTLSAQGLMFTTDGPWTSRILDVSTRSVPLADWIAISPDSGDEAGEYSIEITLEANETGKDRKAEIVITSGEDCIVIHITQVSTPDVPSDGQQGSSFNPLPNVDPADRIVARQYYQSTEFFEYNSKGQLSKITEYRPDYPYDGDMEVTTTSYSYEGLLVESSRRVDRYVKVVQDGTYDWLIESIGSGAYVREEQRGEAMRTEGVLNASGRLMTNKQYRMDYDWFDDVYSEVLSEELSYTYAPEGNLVGVIDNDVIDDRRSSYSLSWQNGNMAWIEYGVDERYTLTYRDTEYKWPGINLYWDFDCEDFYGEVDVTGLDGKKFRNLLDRVSATNPETGETAYCEMVYTFDAKDRVKTMNYRFGESGGVFEDGDDAVTFYYGDEALPQVSVPVYLVRQEPVNATLRPYASEENQYCDACTFTIWKDIRNVFSDGTEKTHRYITSGRLYVEDNPELMRGFDITNEELAQIRNMESPAMSIVQSSGSAGYGGRCAVVTVDYPVIGETPMYVTFHQSADPQYVSLYDSEKAEVSYSHKFDVFTHSVLSSAIQGHWSVSKRVENESLDGSKYAIWQFDHEIKFNLWRELFPGMEDFVTKATMDLYVPVE